MATEPGSGTLESILLNPTMPVLRRWTNGGDQSRVSRTFLAESLRDVEGAPAESLIVVSRRGSRDAGDYRLDVAIRWASLRGAVAIALFGSTAIHQSITALDLAERSQLSLITIPPDTDLEMLLRAASRAIEGGADLALARAELALNSISTAADSSADSGRLAESASAALGVRIEARSPGAGDYGVPPAVLDSPAAFSCVLPEEWALGIATRLIVQTVAGTAARLEANRRRESESSTRAQSELFGELLVSDEVHAFELCDRARSLGLPIDEWHAVVRFEIINLPALQQDEMGRLDLLEVAARDALLTLTTAGPGWCLARSVGAIALVHTTHVDPGPRASIVDVRSVRRALEVLVGRRSDLQLRAGIGAPHKGLAGLRTSAMEARAALRAIGRVGREPYTVTAFDAVGVRRMLLEWYSSASARVAVQEQLAPLEMLGSPRSDVAIRTLGTYLDQQGSVVKTAKELHLHRNAVAYRLQRIFEVLDIDASDPDQRLALQLACRTRLLW
ncbi:MAG: PucR family transcriptional regulator [Candidatus Dormibacteria bacterium]